MKIQSVVLSAVLRSSRDCSTVGCVYTQCNTLRRLDGWTGGLAIKGGVFDSHSWNEPPPTNMRLQ
eukprot:COSAG06_NODE_32770_length_500_cov_1.401496_1_plen_64_part_01